MTVPANWWHSSDELPGGGTSPLHSRPAPQPRIEWMRPDPQPAPTTARPPAATALHLADRLVRWGIGLGWVTVGFLVGSLMVAATTLFTGGVA